MLCSDTSFPRQEPSRVQRGYMQKYVLHIIVLLKNYHPSPGLLLHISFHFPLLTWYSPIFLSHYFPGPIPVPCYQDWTYWFLSAYSGLVQNLSQHLDLSRTSVCHPILAMLFSLVFKTFLLVLVLVLPQEVVGYYVVISTHYLLISRMKPILQKL